mgnify:CR=1 FL=1
MADTVIEARGLVKLYGGHRAVDAIDLDIQRGEFTALMKQLGTLPKEEKPAAGKLINAAKVELEAALAEAERHRQHADDHRQGGHQHRTETHRAGFQRGGGLLLRAEGQRVLDSRKQVNEISARLDRLITSDKGRAGLAEIVTHRDKYRAEVDGFLALAADGKRVAYARLLEENRARLLHEVLRLGIRLQQESRFMSLAMALPPLTPITPYFTLVSGPPVAVQIRSSASNLYCLALAPTVHAIVAKALPPVAYPPEVPISLVIEAKVDNVNVDAFEALVVSFILKAAVPSTIVPLPMYFLALL